MYSGNEKKVFIIKSKDSMYFEEAYFILKENTPPSVKESAMIREANKIVNENFICQPKNKPSKKKNSGRMFFMWFVSGATFSCIVFLCFILLQKIF